MKKMITQHRGRVSLKERMLKNSRAWRRLTRKESGAGLRSAESPGGGRRSDSRPAVHYLAEEDEDEQVSRGLNHLVSRSAAGTQWKKVAVVVRLRSSRESDADEHVSRDRDQANREVRDQGERTSRITGSKSCPSLLRICAQEHMAGRGRGRPLVSASHIIQAGNDLFIVKDEAYIVNRNKKEKSMLRKEGNVHVLDLFVRVPSSVAAPIVHTPMEGRRSRSTATAQLFDGRSSERGRQVQAS